MKFLSDMGISMSTVRSLRDAGHDAVHLREQGLARLPDAEIVEKVDVDRSQLDVEAGDRRLEALELIFRKVVAEADDGARPLRIDGARGEAGGGHYTAV